MGCEVSWFSPLCDGDYLLLPSGYLADIDSVAFAAGIAPLLTGSVKPEGVVPDHQLCPLFVG